MPDCVVICWFFVVGSLHVEDNTLTTPAARFRLRRHTAFSSLTFTSTLLVTLSCSYFINTTTLSSPRQTALCLSLLFFCFSPSELSLRRRFLAPPFQSISHRLSVTISVSSPTSLPTPSPLQLPFSFRSSPCNGFASVTLPEAALSWQLSG